MISLPLRSIFSIFLMGVAFSFVASAMEDEEEPYFIVHNTTERAAQFWLSFADIESETISFERKYRVEIPEGDEHSAFLILIMGLVDSKTQTLIVNEKFNLNIMSVDVRFYDTSLENQVTQLVKLTNGRFFKMVEEEETPNHFIVKLLQSEDD